ncbi:MAG TPA: SDR family oxidoreductase [Pseudonocardiaceae bacterium]|nr:SDR family oxidoreductase [Pseudonocardiaceae bacterium]
MATQDLAGRTALVTGATSGIGAATAVELGRRGAHVLVAGRDSKRGGAVVDKIRSDGGKADFVRADLRDAASARDLAQRATEVGGQIDVLVNNAGIGAFGPTQGFAEDTFDNLFAINVKVPFYLVSEIAPAMAGRGGGAIVNITTMAAQLGIPGMAVYGASKAALNLMTRSWAAEFGPNGVRVNTVSPGPTRTPAVEPAIEMVEQLAAQSPNGQVATPAEIANAVAFLVSDSASYVQGALLNVDGGRTAV